MTVEARDPKRWWVLGVLCFSLLLIVVDNTIVNVALPTIQRELNATTNELQWIVDAYILVFAGLLLTGGTLGDKFGRKGALALGLVVMGGASGLSALADGAGQLIATRAVMGVGAALVMPATLSILTNVFEDPVERGRAIAIWAGTAGMAVAIGPVTGGWLLEQFWWGSVFFVNLPVVVVALVAGARLIPTSRDPHNPRLDVVGALLSVVALVTLVWGIIEAPDKGWLSAPTLAAFAVAAVVLVAFLWWERRVEEPMLDIGLFRNARFSAASAAITLTFFAMFGSFFLMTQYMQFVLGYTALEAGVRMTPMAAVMMVFAPTSARLVEKVGTKAVVGAGMAIAGVGLGLTSLLTPDSTYLNLLGTMVVMSTGMALTMAPATESIMGSLPPAKAGVGSAVNDTTREVGGALGVAVLGSVMSSVYTSTMPDGLPAAARESIGAAMAIAGQAGEAPGRVLAAAASNAFVDGIGVALLIGAGIAGLGSVITWVFLPARGHDFVGDDETTEAAEPAVA
ncbi:MAG TPA: MFS transporter [Acidimicrobiales bacterium]|nr:MFS transporter [Acidimicrobiales bacterium]